MKYLAYVFLAIAYLVAMYGLSFGDSADTMRYYFAFFINLAAGIALLAADGMRE